MVDRLFVRSDALTCQLSGGPRCQPRGKRRTNFVRGRPSRLLTELPPDETCQSPTFNGKADILSSVTPHPTFIFALQSGA